MSRRTSVPPTALRDNVALPLLVASSVDVLEFRPMRFFTSGAWRCGTGIAVASNPRTPEITYRDHRRSTARLLPMLPRFSPAFSSSTSAPRRTPLVVVVGTLMVGRGYASRQRRRERGPSVTNKEATRAGDKEGNSETDRKRVRKKGAGGGGRGPAIGDARNEGPIMLRALSAVRRCQNKTASAVVFLLLSPLFLHRLSLPLFFILPIGRRRCRSPPF